jgi:peroxiredoxin
LILKNPFTGIKQPSLNFTEMKKSILIIFLIFLVFIAGFEISQRTWIESASIRGAFKSHPDTWIYLNAFSTMGVLISDSARSDKYGNFEFKILKPVEDLYMIQVSRNNSIPVLLRKGDDLSISSAGIFLKKKYRVSGSAASDEIRKFEEYIIDEEASIDSLNDHVFLSGNLEEVNQTYNDGLLELQEKKSQVRKRVIDYCKVNPNSLASLYMMSRTFSGSPLFTVTQDLGMMNDLLDSLAVTNPGSSFLSFMTGIVRNYSVNKLISYENENKLRPGAIFPELILPGLDGKQHQLRNSSGYTLVYFWRSDCIHCRIEVELLKEMHKKYSDSGFSIYSISLDDNPERLKEYLDHNPVPWTVVSDFSGWSSPLVRDFNIRGTPTKFLLDKNGFIIDKQFTSDDLNTRLQRII